MNVVHSVVLPAMFGSAIQELAYWWQLRFRLDAKKYRVQISSPAYWVIIVLMVGGSGIGTMYWFDGQVTAAKDCMVFGAAFPLIFKQAVSALTQGRRTLGSSDVMHHNLRSSAADGIGGILRSYFQQR